MEQKKQRGTTSLRKDVLGVIAIVILLLFFMGGSMYVITSEIEFNKAVSSIRSLTTAMGERMEESSNAFKQQINFVTLDGMIADDIKRLDKGELLPIDVRSTIALRIVSTNTIDGVYLYDTSGDVITKWMRTLGRAGIYHLPDRIDTGWYNPSGAVTIEQIDGHIFYNRTIRTLKQGETVGYISFVYSEDTFNSKLKLLAEESPQYLALYDTENGRIISSSDEKALELEPALQETDLRECGEGKFLKTDSGEMLVCSTEIIRDGWYLICAVEREQVFTGQAPLISITILFIGLGLLDIIVLYFIIGRRIIQPLVALSAAVQEIRAGHYQVSLPEGPQNEIGVLTTGIREMSQQIDILVNEKLKGDIEFRNMQISMLRKQIQPHFLYNTMECINALAELGRIDDVRLLTIRFTRLMKSMLEEEPFCVVQKEIEYVRRFLEIYKIIEGERLDYEIFLEESCADCIIPVYLVQPLVENAVLHGIRESRQGRSVIVRVTQQGEKIRILVSDDGDGIPADTLRKIRAYAEGGSEEADGLGTGLRNVIDRIRYLYKGEGIFMVYSDPGWGTSAEIVLPVRK